MKLKSNKTDWGNLAVLLQGIAKQLLGTTTQIIMSENLSALIEETTNTTEGSFDDADLEALRRLLLGSDYQAILNTTEIVSDSVLLGSCWRLLLLKPLRLILRAIN